MAYTKKKTDNADDVMESVNDVTEEVTEEVKNEIKNEVGEDTKVEPVIEQSNPVPVKAVKQYAPTDVISCRSITGGFTNFKGQKTGTVYSWMDNGDISDVEYQDLRAAILSKSPYIFNPILVIEDEDVLNLPEFKEVKKLYESMYTTKDLADILKLPVAQMGQVVANLPKGAKSSLATIAKTKMDNGSLDSVTKIKKLDEILGTDLMLFING